MAGAGEMDVIAADHRWRVLRAGDAGKPLVVLVHGFTGSKENWLPMIAALGKDYRVVAPDLPGWGESQRKPGEDYSPQAQSRRLRSFIDALGAKPTLLVGHSMGGMIVGHAALDRPDIATRLVLMSSAGVQFEENDFAREVLVGRNPFDARSRAAVHTQMGWVFKHPPFLPWPFDSALAELRSGDADYEQQVLRAMERELRDRRLQSRLGEIESPVLLLWCKEDRVVDVSSLPIFQAALPQSRAEILPDCGHMPMMERPTEAADALQRFASM